MSKQTSQLLHTTRCLTCVLTAVTHVGSRGLIDYFTYEPDHLGSESEAVKADLGQATGGWCGKQRLGPPQPTQHWDGRGFLLDYQNTQEDPR